jgi:hypothetical protein
MRLFINLLLIMLLFTSTEESKAQQQHDTTLEGHTIIVRPKYHYKLPTIRDANFCEELGRIRIPNNMTFIDSAFGREFSYFLKFTLIFKKGSIVPSISIRKNKNRDKSVEPIITNIISLLRKTRWKVYPGSQGHEIYFDCSLTKEGIKEVILSSNDNRDLYNACE